MKAKKPKQASSVSATAELRHADKTMGSNFSDSPSSDGDASFGSAEGSAGSDEVGLDEIYNAIFRNCGDDGALLDFEAHERSASFWASGMTEYGLTTCPLVFRYFIWCMMLIAVKQKSLGRIAAASLLAIRCGVTVSAVKNIELQLPCAWLVNGGLKNQNCAKATREKKPTHQTRRSDGLCD